MGDLLPRLRRWWDSARPSWSGARVAYTVVCGCGHKLSGHRRRRHQVVLCPRCGKPVFVLPYSAYPAVHSREPSKLPETARSSRSRRSRRNAWRWPLLAALATFIATVVVFLMAWPYLNRGPETPASDKSPGRSELDQLVKEGRRALADGSFALAQEKFSAAVRLRTSDDRRSLNQLYWQSDLLANLLPANQQEQPLIELLKKASSYPDDDAWQAHFKRNYQGKSVVFDDVLRIAQGRRSLLNSGEPRWNKVRGRVELDDGEPASTVRLKLLENLPLDMRQRWLFGARLASCTRGAEEWVIRFEPDSGVLLTDADAVTAWNPALRNDPQVADVLDRQSMLSRQLLVPDP